MNPTAAVTGVKASLKAAWASLGAAAEHTGSAIGAAARNTGSAVKSADGYVAKRIETHGGFGKAISGISKDHPVYATLAATGAAVGTVYTGSKILGRHTDRVIRERDAGQSNGRSGPN